MPEQGPIEAAKSGDKVLAAINSEPSHPSTKLPAVGPRRPVGQGKGVQHREEGNNTNKITNKINELYIIDFIGYYVYI